MHNQPQCIRVATIGVARVKMQYWNCVCEEADASYYVGAVCPKLEATMRLLVAVSPCSTLCGVYLFNVW